MKQINLIRNGIQWIVGMFSGNGRSEVRFIDQEEAKLIHNKYASSSWHGTPPNFQDGEQYSETSYFPDDH